MKYFVRMEIIIRSPSFYSPGANLAYAGQIDAIVV
jgi:hypothetical protein